MSSILKAQPAALSAALVAVLNALVLLGQLHLSADQISAINIAVVAVLGVFVHQTVTPNGSIIAVRSGGHSVAGSALKGIPNGDPVDVSKAAVSSNAMSQ